jgi:c(7)-type cytochrome triheme protein
MARFGSIRSGLALALMICALAARAGAWQPVARDGLHDPNEPGTAQLQNPAEALAGLPSDPVGNKVDWNKALLGGHIVPRDNVDPGTVTQVLDLDVIMGRTGEMPMVRFPHKPHSLWLDCGNCHEKLFATKAGASKVNMMQILSGQKCGLCHGAVAFPLTECQRCHTVPRPRQ